MTEMIAMIAHADPEMEHSPSAPPSCPESPIPSRQASCSHGMAVVSPAISRSQLKLGLLTSLGNAKMNNRNQLSRHSGGAPA